MCADLERDDERSGSKGREKGQDSTALRRNYQQNDADEGTRQMGGRGVTDDSWLFEMGN